MYDAIRAYVRTLVPIGLGFLASFLVAALLRTIGYELDGQVAYGIVTAASAALVFWLGRQLETSRFGVLAFVGRFLLSLGADLGQPTYPGSPDMSSKSVRSIPPPRGY